jgi:hypothetical protein
MALTNVNLNRIDGSVGSISTASISNIKNPNSASNNVVLNSDGTTTLTPSNIIKSETAKPTTSGTEVLFTGIPSWVKRITVMFNGVSTNGSSAFLIQLGSGSISTSGYQSNGVILQNGVTPTSQGSTAGFISANSGAATDFFHGVYVFNLLGSNFWTGSGSLVRYSGTYQTHLSVGGVALGGLLDRLRLTTVNGTDTFDAGSVNILYEG